MIPTDRLGCSTITFRMLDLEGALGRIAAADLRAVDLGVIARFCPHADPVAATDADAHRLRDQVEAAGLRVASVNAWSLTHLNDPDSVELPYLRATLRLAVGVGAPVVSVQPGRAVDREDWADAARQVASQLELLGAEARDLGVALAVEAPHKGTLAQEFGDVRALVDLLDEELVGIALDTSHVLNAGATIAEALDCYGPRVRHVHLRDYLDGSILVTPGDGEIDFAAVADGLERLGYEGSYSLELEARDATADDMDRELRRALDHLTGAGVAERS